MRETLLNEPWLLFTSLAEAYSPLVLSFNLYIYLRIWALFRLYHKEISPNSNIKDLNTVLSSDILS